MARCKIDRTAIFLCLVFILFLWDLAYFLGFRNPERFPHPFVYFRTLGDVEFLRGFPAMLRHIIFSSVSGRLIGLGVACLIARSVQLTLATVSVLRLGLWLPFLVLFATPDPFVLGIAAAMFCSCYHYLVARETTLQVLLISLISQIWLQSWNWFLFVATNQLGAGFGVLVTLTALLIFIHWIFRSDFDVGARQYGTIINKVLTSTNWISVCEFLVFAFVVMIIWQMVVHFRFPNWPNSPLGVIAAGYQLLTGREIYGDMLISLSVLIGGLALGGSISAVVYALFFGKSVIRNLVFRLLSLFYILPIVLWLLCWFVVPRWVPDFLNLWHKVIAVGLLVFFPFIQVLWGLRDRAVIYRILLAIDNALPIAFVGMLFAELFASQSGLRFGMTVASAAYEFDKGFVGFLIVTLLLLTLSTTLRWLATRFSFVKEPYPIIPISVT